MSAGKGKSRLVFEGYVDDDGNIRTPTTVQEDLRTRRRERVAVQLTARPMARELARRGIKDEEIDRIAAVQLEPTEQAIRFLLSEGVLAGSGARRRSAPGKKGK